MKRFILPFFIAIIFFSACSEPVRNAKEEIKAIMEQQSIDWSEGNMEGFMDAYIKSDSLGFMGKKGIRYGWQATLDSYKKGYPDKDAMGKLTFQYLEFKEMGDNNMFVAGYWNLDRKQDTLNGYFTLIWELVDGEWKVIFDHTP